MQMRRNISANRVVVAVETQPSYNTSQRKQRSARRLPLRSIMAAGAILTLLCAVCVLASLYRQLDYTQKSNITIDEPMSPAPSAAFCARGRPPFVCAHGGDTSNHPPNTAAAYAAAMAKASVDCIELDVSLSSDSKLVNIHDRDLQQLLGKPGARVINYSLAELQSAEFAWPSSNQSVLTVSAALAATAPFVKHVVLDVKVADVQQAVLRPNGSVTTEGVAIIEALMQLPEVQRCSNCLIWTKSDELARKVKELNPRQKAGYVVMYDRGEYNSAISFEEPLRKGLQDIEVAAVYHGMLDAQLVATLRAANKSVYTWTVDEPGHLKHVLDLGVDAIVTNQPGLAAEAVNQYLKKCG